MYRFLFITVDLKLFLFFIAYLNDNFVKKSKITANI